MYRTRARYCARMLGPWDGPWASLTLHGGLDTVSMEAEAALPRPARAASPLRGTVWSMSGHLKTRPFFLAFPPGMIGSDVSLQGPQRYPMYLGTQVLDAVTPPSSIPPRPSAQCQWPGPFPTEKRRHIMTGGAGRARSSLFAPPTVRTPGEGLPVDRFYFLSSAGHRQKRWIPPEAGRPARQAGQVRISCGF